MDEMKGKNTGGRRVASGSPGGKAAVIVIAVLLGAYLALCAYAGGDKFWPHTSVMGVDVSGLTAAQAEEKLTSDLPRQLAEKTVVLLEPQSGKSLTLAADGMTEPVDLSDALRAAGPEGNFLTRGARYLMNLVSGAGGRDVSIGLQYTEEGERRIEETLSELTRELGIDGNETTYELTDEAIVFTKGITGTAVDTAAVRDEVAAALMGTGSETVEVPLIQAPPEEPDLEAIRDEVYTEAANASYDKEKKTVTESVTGRDFDVERAKAALENTKEGEKCVIALSLTQPEITTEDLESRLFRDVLGEAVSKVTGSSVRVTNVKVTAGFVNDQVVLAGEEFSYSKVCSPFTVSNGYGKAPAYVGGLSKDVAAGGACQCSSTLYWATLRANLETVERHAHGYEPSYVPGGLDATVYGDYGTSGSLDFRFRNSTDYPIKLSAYVDSKKYLHVTIYGTDTTGIHGEPYSTNRVVTKYAQTVYEPNDSIPRGTTQKDSERTAYNAVTIDTYQKLVDSKGNVISEKLLYKTSYRARNAVIFYNPEDAALWGIDTSTGLKTLTPVTPAPAASPSPSQNPAPVESQEPVTPPASPSPSVSVPPAESTAPAESAPPAETGHTPPAETPDSTPSSGPDDPLLPAE